MIPDKASFKSSGHARLKQNVRRSTNNEQFITCEDQVDTTVAHTARGGVSFSNGGDKDQYETFAMSTPRVNQNQNDAFQVKGEKALAREEGAF